MLYKRDIKRLVKEKDRLRKIIEGIGKGFADPFFSSSTASAFKAKELIREAVDKLHEAELYLRKYE